jgi:hypothetical protein
VSAREERRQPLRPAVLPAPRRSQRHHSQTTSTCVRLLMCLIDIATSETIRIAPSKGGGGGPAGRGGGSSSFVCGFGKLYIHSAYVAKGLNDCGFLELVDIGVLGERLETVSSTTTWKERATVGKSVVAHGLVYLRGCVTSAQDDHGRFSVTAHSVPGQSGSLVFGNDKSVFGVVHGSSKHRGKHAAGTHEDSSFVYCDTVVYNDLICVQGSNHISLLQKAESVPVDVASGSMPLSEFVEQNEIESRAMLELAELLGKKTTDTLAVVMSSLLETVRGPIQVSFHDPQLMAWTTEST